MMQTDDLLTRLAAEAPQPPLRPDRMVATVIAAAALSSALFLAVAGVRDDLVAALAEPQVLAKTLLPAVLCLFALPVAMRSARPGAQGSSRLPLLVLSAAVALFWLASFAARSPETRFADATGPAVAECLGFILLLSVIPAGLAIIALRRGAPTRPRLAGAIAGLGAAAGAACGYSLYCVQDNPLFFLTWYGVAILIVMAASAAIGGRLLRW